MGRFIFLEVYLVHFNLAHLIFYYQAVSLTINWGQSMIIKDCIIRVGTYRLTLCKGTVFRDIDGEST